MRLLCICTLYLSVANIARYGNRYIISMLGKQDFLRWKKISAELFGTLDDLS